MRKMEIKMPCNLGDTGYLLRKYPINNTERESYHYTGLKIVEVTIDNIMLRKKGNGYPEGLYWVDEFNIYKKFDEDIFTLFEDAERALERRKNKNAS